MVLSGNKAAAPQQKNEAQRKIETWLSKEQFDKAMLSDKKGITATISAFTSGTKGMKKEYLTSLTQQLKTL